jgi:hypothetical protein
MIRPVGSDIVQQARRSQLGSDNQGTSVALSNEQAGWGRSCTGSKTHTSCLWQAWTRRSKYFWAVRHGQNLCRKTYAVNLALSQGTVGAGSHQQAGRVRRCAGSHTQSNWLWESGNRTRMQSYAGRHGQTLRKKSEEVTFAPRGREMQVQALMSRQAGAEVAQ